MNQVAKALSPTTPTRSEATRVEQSRAIAEVQAAVVVAQQAPRSTAESIRKMHEATSQMGLAEHAFFKFSRGGGSVEGPSIHLATELARCWGNIDYCLKELARDGAQSEMYAYAWDLETNARAGITFLVPHTRDTKNGPKPLLESRDVYENNANHGARRLREMIFRVLPKWFVEEAETRCRETLAKGASDKPLAQQIAEMLAAYSSNHGISRERIEAKIGRVADHFTPIDLAALRVSYRSIKDREISADEEFPSTAKSIVSAALESPNTSPPASASEPPKPGAPPQRTEETAADSDPWPFVPLKGPEKEYPSFHGFHNAMMTAIGSVSGAALDKLMEDNGASIQALERVHSEAAKQVFDAAGAKGWTA